ncbi:unnamed protein product [Vicia faba]|uniref:Replication protein A 70 kDa DNA-binding subunit B/D first OB fold domain-containing protein n=1 Tax=Vicia faba TaxID=3906 RepID=A0AAV1ABQ3_VICFA|nr:unnamed protein product [Vicia faba]
MARPVEKISDINDNKELWKLAVRVHHRWNVVSNNKVHFEMIFVDKAGGDIHVVVPAAHMSLFDKKTRIGSYLHGSAARLRQATRNNKLICNNTLNCTLWESYVEQFVKYNQDRADASVPIVVLLQYAKVKEEGKYPLSVTNTYHVTMLCLDADFPLVKEFIDR